MVVMKNRSPQTFLQLPLALLVILKSEEKVKPYSSTQGSIAPPLLIITEVSHSFLNHGECFYS